MDKTNQVFIQVSYDFLCTKFMKLNFAIVLPTAPPQYTTLGLFNVSDSSTIEIVNKDSESRPNRQYCYILKISVIC